MLSQKEYACALWRKARVSTVFPHEYSSQRLGRPSSLLSYTQLNLPLEDEYIRRNTMTQRVEEIGCLSWDPYDADKMVSTHAPISHGLNVVVSANGLEIQRTNMKYDDPSKAASIQRATRDCDPEEQLQDNNDNKVNPSHMMITCYERDSTTSDDLLLIPDEESYNGK